MAIDTERTKEQKAESEARAKRAEAANKKATKTETAPQPPKEAHHSGSKIKK